MEINDIEVNYAGKLGIGIDDISIHNDKGHFIYETDGKRYFVDFSSAYSHLDIMLSGGASDPCLAEIELTIKVTTNKFEFHPLFVLETPKKMTIAQIEKELGHKIFIINK